jgi:hypothetical protein
LATHRPLRGVVVGVYEAWDEEVAGWDGVELRVRRYTCLVDFVWRSEQGDDLAGGVDDDGGVGEDFEGVETKGMQDRALEDK